MKTGLLPLCLIAGLTIAGCAGGATIDHGKAERLLVGLAPTGGPTVVKAQCPSGVSATAGKSFDCQVKLSDGTTGTWTMHVVNDQGLVTANGSDFAANPPKPGASEVGKTKLATASGGVKLEVTLVAFTPHVNEPSGDALTHIAGVQLRIKNVGRSLYRADKPGDMTILLLTNTTGADVPQGMSGPCGGSFYSTPLRVKPGASVEGCIPEAVPNNATVASFKLTPKGEAGVAWSLG